MSSAGLAPGTPDDEDSTGIVYRFLAWMERIGNRLPDPAALFVLALGVVWLASALLAG